ncbi:respiratory nitrate reductase subunit gamma, partial [Acinetobacter sp. 163]|nr:respiratory nitrate reductase subunit gamma [Acinetobacter sp. 163]
MVDLHPVYLTGVLMLLGLLGLLGRRFIVKKVAYISLLNDYFPLALLIGIALTGMNMAYLNRVDIE